MFKINCQHINNVKSIFIKPEQSISVNIITDFGAVTNGTDTYNSFLNFRNWARLQTLPIVLTIPAGDYTFNYNQGLIPFSGIKKITILAYGAKFICNQSAFRIVGGGFSQSAGKSARVQSVLNGQSTITLVNLSDASFFAVNDWVSVSGLEMQGTSGYPPNHHFNYYCQILAINANTGTLILSRNSPDTIKSTWPNTSSGIYDTGGPATIFNLMTAPAFLNEPYGSWDIDLTIMGLTIENNFGDPGSQVYMNGRSVKFIDMTFLNCAPIATVNQYALHERCTARDIMVEVDKECEYVEYKNCDLRAMIVQSTSVNTLVRTNNTFTHFCQGTAKNTIDIGNTVNGDYVVGVIGYGVSESLICNNNIFSNSVLSPILLWSDQLTYNNGKLTYTGGGVISWLIPQAKCFVGASSQIAYCFPFTILDVEVDAFGRTVAITDLSDNPNNILSSSILPIWYAPIPIANITAQNNSGNLESVGFPNNGIAGSIFSRYYKVSSFETGIFAQIYGKLISMRVNVIKADTGANNTAPLHISGPFDNTPMLKPDGTKILMGDHWIFNAKISGERVLTTTNVTGAQTGDILEPFGTICHSWGINPVLTTNLIGYTTEDKPIIEIEIITDPLTSIFV